VVLRPRPRRLLVVLRLRPRRLLVVLRPRPRRLLVVLRLRRLRVSAHRAPPARRSARAPTATITR
jgi:hypothetical protein